MAETDLEGGMVREDHYSLPTQYFVPPQDPSKMDSVGSLGHVLSNAVSLVRMGPAAARLAPRMTRYYNSPQLNLGVTDRIIGDMAPPRRLEPGFTPRPLANHPELVWADWAETPQGRRAIELTTVLKEKNRAADFLRSKGFGDRLPVNLAFNVGETPPEADLVRVGLLRGHGVAWAKLGGEQFDEHPVDPVRSIPDLRAVEKKWFALGGPRDTMERRVHLQEHIPFPPSDGETRADDWNVIYRIELDGTIVRFGTAQQAVAGTSHIGNIHTGTEDSDGLCYEIVEMLRDEGFIGDLGFDTRRDLKIVEINARGNGHHPMAATARRLGHGHFYAGRSLKGIDLPLDDVLGVLSEGHGFGTTDDDGGLVLIQYGFIETHGSASVLSVGQDPFGRVDRFERALAARRASRK